MFIQQRGGPAALAQVFEINMLIYTVAALAFPRDGDRILTGRKILKVNQVYRN